MTLEKWTNQDAQVSLSNYAQEDIQREFESRVKEFALKKSH